MCVRLVRYLQVIAAVADDDVDVDVADVDVAGFSLYTVYALHPARQPKLCAVGVP